MTKKLANKIPIAMTKKYDRAKIFQKLSLLRQKMNPMRDLEIPVIMASERVLRD